MSALTGKRIVILATHGFEQSELDEPHAALQKAGATVDIVAPEAGEIKGWHNKDGADPSPSIAHSIRRGPRITTRLSSRRADEPRHPAR